MANRIRENCQCTIYINNFYTVTFYFILTFFLLLLLLLKCPKEREQLLKMAKVTKSIIVYSILHLIIIILYNFVIL